MELLNSEIDTSPIVNFCNAVICRHAENWPPKDKMLADEFVEWLDLKPFLSRDKMIELCSSKRINLSFAELPSQLRGFNCSFENTTEIVIAQHESVPGADLHTLLHEFRELLENCFIELGLSTLGEEGDLELQAELFAMSARMMVVTREIPSFVEIVNNTETKWARYLGYGVLGAIGFIYLLSCVALPQLEQIESEAKR
jgi:hypothetical protein